MNILMQIAGKKIVPVVVVTMLTVLTLGTSVMGMAKASNSFGTSQTSQQQAARTGATAGSGGGQAQAATQNTTATNGATGTTGGTSVGTKTTATNQLALNTGTGTVVTQNSTPPSGSGGCIITVFGKQYDVTKLKTTHSGGDVFSCGTDMTAQYQAQHGTNVSRLAAYLVTTNTAGTGTSVATSGSVQSGSGTSVSATNHCIVTIFGKQYDVTTLQSNTPGGTFACGTDMTTQYQAIHGTNVAMLQPYLVVSSPTASGNTGLSGTSSGTTGGNLVSGTVSLGSSSSEGQNRRQEIEDAEDGSEERLRGAQTRERADD